MQHVEVPVPKAKKNELLLKLEAASINPVDWKMQKGVLRPLLPLRLPYIPVTDVAGVVVVVGSGVHEFKAGDEVVAMLNPFQSGGGLAEYAVASVKLTVKRPAGVSATEGAGLPIAAGTALQSLRSIGAKFDGTGKPLNVLVTAASGGVGLYAVQLAKLAGLPVTATCGARNVELVRGLGADEVLDYKTPEVASMRSPSGRRYDGVVHCTVGVRWSAFKPLLSATGKVIDITANLSAFLTAVLHRVTFARKRLVPLLLWPNRADLEFLVGLVKDGKLKTVVDSRFPLRDASHAWEKSIEGHATGKIVVQMEG
ncbi:putative quinone-oxidoreductase-like protein, chloroplastic [Dichanthelium oligosanthes]|uniref:Putative quinone-oxidoreductase-like protein, chloroplastic n=1 Tax=Dichanthelium oligosanthes TaxID=888268 RepID=A0A1E5W280_9POAL|nr:putative quinone-oxidoreductase-like protein, chloroplastic [Dichanthelium oligosanthes]